MHFYIGQNIRQNGSETKVSSKKRIDFTNNDEGTVIQLHKECGVGIDCHSKFLQISVIVKAGQEFKKYQHTFPTDPKSIDAARKWVIDTIEKNSVPPITVKADTLSYSIESTSTYHLPVVQRWGGIPEIVNPKLAGSSHRKTDVLDATMLARQNIDGLWKTSFVPPRDVWVLRSLISQKESFEKAATKISNQINSHLLKFGITVGRDGSVTGDNEVRKCVMDLLSDNPSEEVLKLYPLGIPDEAKALIRELYELHDENAKKEEEYRKLAIEKVCSMEWETKDGVLSGKDMMQLLQTVPGVGPNSALNWLANIITPRRFANARAICAYCSLDPSVKISAQHVTSTVKRGGNKAIHKSLCFAASGLMSKRAEPFGIWGFKLYQATGKWKKGTNAVARRMAMALYYVQSSGQPFDYNKFTFMEMPEVIDMSIIDLVAINPEFHRYIAGFNAANIKSTQDMADRYHNGSLHRINGLAGKNLQSLVKEFINNQDLYTERFNEYSSKRELIYSIVNENNQTIKDFVSENPQFSRYYNALDRAGITHVSHLINMYYSGTLKDYPRLGINFELLVEQFIDNIIKERKERNTHENIPC